jgi:outer membrane protein assembly factor BamB
MKNKIKIRMNKSRFLLSIISILILSSLLSSCLGAGAATQVQIWPGLTIDAEKQIGYVASGNRVFSLDLTNGAEKWRFPITPEKNLGFSAPPTLTKDGQLVAGAYNKTLYSLDPQTGQQKWINQDATNRYYAGGLALDQNIYAPNIDHNLYTVNSAGSLAWKFKAQNALWSAPVTDGKLIYLGGMDHILYALDPNTGKVVWQTEGLGGSMASSPTLSDGKLYVGTFNNEMLALDAANGKILWRAPVSGWVYASPLLDNGVLYFGNLDGAFYALDAATGKQKWQVQPDTSANRAISGAAAIIGDTVFFNSRGGIIYALDKASGAKRWDSVDKPCCWNSGKSTLGKLYSPIKTINDLILVTPMGVGPLVVALDVNGNQKWSYTPAK